MSNMKYDASNYEQLTSPETKKRIEGAFCDDSEQTFKLKNSHFAVFSKKELDEQSKNALNKNWKIHFSIHPEDVAYSAGCA